MSNRPNFLHKPIDDFDDMIQQMKNELEATVQQQSKKYDFDFSFDEPRDDPKVFQWKIPENKDFFKLKTSN